VYGTWHNTCYSIREPKEEKTMEFIKVTQKEFSDFLNSIHNGKLDAAKSKEGTRYSIVGRGEKLLGFNNPRTGEYLVSEMHFKAFRSTHA
jgi:hypothetical protein